MRRLSFAAVHAITKACPTPSLLIDVREPDECRGGMIPTAINIPLNTIPCAVEKSPEEFRAAYGVPKPAFEDNLVIYCQRGGRAEKGACAFSCAGFKNVDLYPGSWLDWSANLNK